MEKLQLSYLHQFFIYCANWFAGPQRSHNGRLRQGDDRRFVCWCLVLKRFLIPKRGGGVIDSYYRLERGAGRDEDVRMVMTRQRQPSDQELRCAQLFESNSPSGIIKRYPVPYLRYMIFCFVKLTWLLPEPPFLRSVTRSPVVLLLCIGLHWMHASNYMIYHDSQLQSAPIDGRLPSEMFRVPHSCDSGIHQVPWWYQKMP